MRALAELRFFHSRPFAPTRRLALAPSTLPVDPAPGPGGVLLGALVAAGRERLDEDAYQSLMKLTIQLQEGQRIVQPRLRHRFQEDTQGLAKSSARLVRTDDGLALDVDNEGTPLQLAVIATYTAGSLPFSARRSVMDAIRKGLRWSGAIDRSLFAHLSGLDSGREWSADIYDDPVGWALSTLGIGAAKNGAEHNGSIHLPDRSAIQRAFRDALRTAHPDHGGESDDAATRISDITEARRILLS